MRKLLIALLAALALPAAACQRPEADGAGGSGGAGDVAKPRETGKPGDADLCTRGVERVFHLVTTVGTPPGKAPKISADEQKVIRAATQLSIAQCRAEGFTQAQLDCILAAEDFEAFTRLGSCPAIAARHPSWLGVPPAGDPVP